MQPEPTTRTDARGRATRVSAGVELRPIAGGVTAPRGFRASGIHCGIRRERPDLALLATDADAAAAGVFTANRLPAAPVVLAREHLRLSAGRAGGVVVNSGNANACTGAVGMAHARQTVAEAARLLGLPPERVLVCSTGVIGVPLPIDRLLAGLPDAVAGLSEDASAAAQAILTTDTCTKEAALEVRWNGPTFRVGGMAKGSGMIHPNLATTLAFVTTDAPVPPGLLDASLRRAAERTFNRITVDGDTSTNDAILALANGRAGEEPLAQDGPGHDAFAAALEAVLRRLALMVVADGEGATRVLEVVVRGAVDEAQATRAAKEICRSPLVKTALHGADPNWGRIAAAAGNAGVDLDPDRLTVAIAGLLALGPGQEVCLQEEETARRMAEDHVTVEVDLGAGSGEAVAWTCDLSADYVRINADYRT